MGEVLGGGLRALAFFIGPPLTSKPFHLMWEDRGAFALLGVTVAVLAPWLGGPRVKFHGLVCLVLIVTACVLITLLKLYLWTRRSRPDQTHQDALEHIEKFVRQYPFHLYLQSLLSCLMHFLHCPYSQLHRPLHRCLYQQLQSQCPH